MNTLNIFCLNDSFSLAGNQAPGKERETQTALIFISNLKG